MVRKINEKKYDLVCIGEITVDIICDSLNNLPGSGQFLVVDDICFYPGGCPTNTAIVASKFGLKTCLLSNMGKDSWGEYLLKELKTESVVTDFIKVFDNEKTGKSIIIIVKNKDRIIIHDNGVNERLNVGDIDWSLIKQSKALLISSYISALPNLSRKDVVEIFKFAKNNESLTFLDVLIDPDTAEPVKHLEGLLEYVDFLIINNDEGKLLTGFDEYKKQANCLLEKGANNVIIKLGKYGSYLKNSKNEIFSEPFEENIIRKDPTGSGDAFNAGIIYGSLQNWNIRDTMRFANITGASAITKIGCTAGVYSLKKILRIMEERF